MSTTSSSIALGKPLNFPNRSSWAPAQVCAYDNAMDNPSAQSDPSYQQSPSPPPPLSPQTELSYLVTSTGALPDLAPSVAAHPIQTSQTIFSRAANGALSPTDPGAFTTSAALYRPIPTRFNFDKLEATQADYRAMMTYSSKAMLALSQNKSTEEVGQELLISLAGSKPMSTATARSNPSSPARRS
ncbi:hypothetical protein H4R34_003527 [Dimargaris verticillata]|uniref:Uncharacterized protein n=1 Tax=Dimargaris verticillata TaxID=2761393 RepID=A0A9W8EBY1_9FUNG|nr:hypothetical protein H4R34_003527 [Dimargaris verticillata]